MGDIVTDSSNLCILWVIWALTVCFLWVILALITLYFLYLCHMSTKCSFIFCIYGWYEHYNCTIFSLFYKKLLLYIFNFVWIITALYFLYSMVYGRFYSPWEQWEHNSQPLKLWLQRPLIYIDKHYTAFSADLYKEEEK